MIKASDILVIRHVTCSGLGLLEQVLQHEMIPVTYLDIAAGETLTTSVKDYSHIIVLGGPVSAYEDDLYPFLRYEFGLVETAIANHIPILGICLGSQVLAKVLGANVYRGENGREAGWYDLHLTHAGHQDPLFQGFPQPFRVFESHQDTFDIPSGCVHLATSAKYPNQAFRYQDFVWAIQFHLEMSETVLVDCSAVLEQELAESNIQHTSLPQLIAEARRYVPSIEPHAYSFMRQFLQVQVKEAVH
jgi:GMP synthase-like glutamine amidotransferase